MEAQFNLSASIPHHQANLRTVACNNEGLVLTGSFDKSCAFFTFNPSDNSYTFRNSTNYHNDYIYCVRSSVTNQGFFSGSKDRQIIYMDNSGNPLAEFLGHEGTVSCLYQNKTDYNLLSSGSWDATAKIWDIEKMTNLYTLSGHSYAVSIISLPGQKYITGSQDKKLNFWDKDKLVTSVPNAHDDIIRGIILSKDGNSFYTTSNDQTIKQWDMNGHLLNVISDAHMAFIFGLNYNTVSDQLISFGDDCVVKLWYSNGNSQSLIHPKTVWDCAVNPLNGDLLTASGDGILRVFSSNPSRWLSAESLDEYTKLCEMSQAKEDQGSQQENNDVEISKMTPIEQMYTLKNIKEGEIRLFNNNGKGEAYMFQNGSWQLIGEVLGKKNDKTFYPGDAVFPAGEYDYVFDVELEGGMSKLPFNEGDNALMVAEKFVGREKLHKAYTDDVRKFLRNNTGKKHKKAAPVITQQKSENKPRAPPKKSEVKNVGQLKNYSFPILNYFSFDTINVEGPIKKIGELNAAFPADSPLKLSDARLKQVTNACRVMCEKQMYHSSMFNEYEIKEFFNLIPTWTGGNAVPILDCFRMFLLHPESNDVLKKMGGGIGELAIILNNIEKNTEVINSILSLRVLTNFFYNEVPRNLVTEKVDKILELLANYQENNNKHIRATLCNLFFNFSILLYNREGLSDSVIQLLALVNEVIANEQNESNLIKLLKCLGNLFIASENNRAIGKDMDIISTISNISSTDEEVQTLKNYISALLS